MKACENTKNNDEVIQNKGLNLIVKQLQKVKNIKFYVSERNIVEHVAC
jgi:hypothetical protein